MIKDREKYNTYHREYYRNHLIAKQYRLDEQFDTINIESVNPTKLSYVDKEADINELHNAIVKLLVTLSVKE